MYQGRRRHLVDYLRSHRGISDPGVLQAMGQVPRHLFLESAFSDFAYQDRALPIQADQTISHPSTVAEQTQLLGIQSGQKVLEIGTGCGYQTCVLHCMGAEVYTIERQISLYQFAIRRFQFLEIDKLYARLGDGFMGWPEVAPFDAILVTCGVDTLPMALMQQLKVGGRLVIPIGEGQEQVLYRYTRLSHSDFEKESFGIYHFVPLIRN